MSTKMIRLASEEILSILNILNEVCYGLYVQNFETTIGSQKK